MTQADYEVKPKKKFPWGWLIGGVFVLLFGGCSYLLMGVFKNVGVVKPLNDGFIEKVLSDQLPSASSGTYSEVSGITDDALAPVNLMIETLGPPDSIGETSCSGQSNASTNEISGQFVTCSGSVTYSISPATLAIRWRKEDDVWKLLHFNLNVADVEAYSNLRAEKILLEKEAE